jgi:hypothetical protein
MNWRKTKPELSSCERLHDFTCKLNNGCWCNKGVFCKQLSHSTFQRLKILVSTVCLNIKITAFCQYLIYLFSVIFRIDSYISATLHSHSGLSSGFKPCYLWGKNAIFVKSKFYPTSGHEGPKREEMFISAVSLTSPFDAVGVQGHLPVDFLRDRTGTLCISSKMGSRAGLDGRRKISSHRVSILGTFGP